jgi:mono/diheme cytochrome c family protein
MTKAALAQSMHPKPSIRSTIPILRSVLLLGALLSGCSDLPGRPDPAQRERAPEEILDFETLYAANCSGCHGAEGHSGAGPILADASYLGIIPESALLDAIRSGSPGTPMPAWAKNAGGSLTDAQIQAIATGMRQRWGRASAAALDVASNAASTARPPAYARPADASVASVARGARVFEWGGGFGRRRLLPGVGE